MKYTIEAPDEIKWVEVLATMFEDPILNRGREDMSAESCPLIST